MVRPPKIIPPTGEELSVPKTALVEALEAVEVDTLTRSTLSHIPHLYDG